MTLTLVLIDSTVTGTRLVEISVIRMVSCEVDKMVSGMVSVVVLSFLIVLIDTLEKIIVLSLCDCHWHGSGHSLADCSDRYADDCL